MLSADEAVAAGDDVTAAAAAADAVAGASGAYTCTGVIDVPDLASTTDTMTTITCALDESPATACDFKLFVGPHPLLECPVVPSLTPSGAAASTEPFGDNPAVTCEPATAGGIPGGSFPTEVGTDAAYTVTCSSTETPNTCSFDVVLRAGALQRTCRMPCC